MSYSESSTPLEEWLRTELGRPVGPTEAGRRRVMLRVRAEHPRQRPGRSRPRSRLLGLALAAGLSGVVALRISAPLADHLDAERTAQRGFVDTVAGALEDTLRVVRFMLIAPTATRVALVGDFNRWDPRATPLARDTGEQRGTWMAAIPLGDGRHRYAFVVDDTQWIADPAAARREYVDGRRASVLELGERRE